MDATMLREADTMKNTRKFEAVVDHCTTTMRIYVLLQASCEG